MSFFTELKRRNVFRVGLFYIVASWLIVQVAETLLPVFEVSDAVLRAIVLILVLGFVPALVFAWAFELTPDGLKRDSDADVDPEIKRRTANKLNWATLVVAALAIGLLVTDRMMPESTPAIEAITSVESGSEDQPEEVFPDAEKGPDPASIAVLPFADLSPQGDQQYFSDGIAEEILNVLSKIESLNVTSRTSAFAFKSQSEMGIRDIAEELQVRHVLEGSVRKAAETIRVTAQLIDATSDQHLWSETYDRNLTAENVFAIQDEIAQAITRELEQQLGVVIDDGAQVDGGTSDLDAYEAFLAGRDLFINRNYTNLPRAVTALERAVAADPDFARAHGWLAMAYVVSPAWGFEEREFRSLGRASARRALAIEADTASALIALGFASQMPPNPDFEQAIDYYERAIESDPQATTAHLWLSQIWRSLGFFGRAIQAVERCLKVDPNYPLCIYSSAEYESMRGNYEASIEKLRDVFSTEHEEAYPQFLGTVAANDDDFLMLLMLGELADMVGPGSRWMVDDLERALSDEQYDREAALDRLESRIRAEAPARGRDPDAYTRTAYLLAFRAYDKIPENEGEADAWWWFPDYPGLNESPYRKQAMTNTGLPEFWRKHGFPPQCRPIGEDDFECD